MASMDTFNQSVDKLSTLMAMGHITQEEFERRRKQLVDQFVGIPTSRPGAMRRPGVGRGMRPRGFGMFPAYGGGFFQPAFGGMGGGYPGFPGAMRHGGFGGMGHMGFMPYDPYFRPMRRGPCLSIKVQPVPELTSVEDLTDAFAQYGEVTSAAIKEGTPRYGYVNFKTQHAASAAAVTRSIILQGQDCAITRHYRQAPEAVVEAQPSSGIGIFNMPFSMSQEEVEAMLQAYTGFQVLKYVKNKFGQFRGYVFAYFDSEDNATNAKTQLQGTKIGEQVLDVKYSTKTADEALKDPAE